MDCLAKSAWSNWGAWSSCSVTCGGCGKQRRIRACYGSDRICPGPNEEAKRCGEKRCKIQGKFDCTARLVMPCSLYHKLQFGTNKELGISSLDISNSDYLNFCLNFLTDAHVLVSDKFATYPYKEKQYLKSVFAGEKLCEKHLRYLCSTPTLTVYLGQITRNNLLSSDKRGCCDEYHYNGTICIQDGNIFP
uniref:Uncharacterized protein n=1 Tax=Setaria digitata TaxID=48799 RepID=A0A915PNE2_9BILA